MKSYTLRMAFTDVRPWLTRSSVRLFLWSPLPVPPTNREPEKMLPPSFGSMFTCAPPYSYCAEPSEPVSMSVSCAASGLM